MRAQRGFSVVELMVAMTISLLLLAGGVSVMYTSRLTYDENSRVARLQEYARASMEIMLRDLRGAGHPGCARAVDGTRFLNALSNSTELRYNFGVAVQGYEGTSGTFSPTLPTTVIPSATTQNDVLVARTQVDDMQVFRTRTAFTGGTGSIEINKRSGQAIPLGTVLLVSDCDYASIFTNSTAVPSSGGTATLDRGTGALTPPAGMAQMPQNSSTSFPSYPTDSWVSALQTVVYYIRPSGSGSGPALWRIVGNAEPQELVEGVERMEIQYGVDTDDDLLVDAYRTAANVTDWAEVLSVSLAVLIRSPEQSADTSPNARTFNMLGTTVGPFNDKRPRILFTTTVALRNRATTI